MLLRPVLAALALVWAPVDCRQTALPLASADPRLFRPAYGLVNACPAPEHPPVSGGETSRAGQYKARRLRATVRKCRESRLQRDVTRWTVQAAAAARHGKKVQSEPAAARRHATVRKCRVSRLQRDVTPR